MNAPSLVQDKTSAQPPASHSARGALFRGRAIQWGAIAAGVLIGLLGWLSWSASETLVFRAEQLLFDGKTKEALLALKPLLKAAPPDGSACFFAGQASAQLGQLKEAAHWYGQVPVGHARRGEACF